MTDLQMLGDSFCKFGLVLTYQRFNSLLAPFKNSLLKILAQLPTYLIEFILPIARKYIYTGI